MRNPGLLFCSFQVAAALGGAVGEQNLSSWTTMSVRERESYRLIFFTYCDVVTLCGSGSPTTVRHRCPKASHTLVSIETLRIFLAGGSALAMAFSTVFTPYANPGRKRKQSRPMVNGFTVRSSGVIRSVMLMHPVRSNIIMKLTMRMGECFLRLLPLVQRLCLPHACENGRLSPLRMAPHGTSLVSRRRGRNGWTS